MASNPASAVLHPCRAPLHVRLLAKRLLMCRPCSLVVHAAQEALQANSRLAAGMSHQHHHQPRGKERSLKSATGLAAASTAVHQAAYHTAAGAATASFFPPAKRQHAMTSAAGTLRPPTGCRRLQAGSMRGGSRGGSAGSNGKGSRSSSTRSSMRTTSGGDEYGGTGGAVGGGAAGDGVIGAGAGAGAGVRRGMEAALRLLESRAYAELPPPLAGPGTNWESDHTTCYINQELQVRDGRQRPQGAHRCKQLSLRCGSGRLSRELAAGTGFLRCTLGPSRTIKMMKYLCKRVLCTCMCPVALPVQSVVVQPTNGWNWTDESRGKWGWVATEVGMSLDFKVGWAAARLSTSHQLALHAISWTVLLSSRKRRWHFRCALRYMHGAVVGLAVLREGAGTPLAPSLGGS